MSKYLKYKGNLYRAVDAAIGDYSREAENAIAPVRRELEKVENFVKVAKQLISQWESAYASGDLSRANRIKSQLSKSSRWDNLVVSGEHLPLFKV